MEFSDKTRFELMRSKYDSRCHERFAQLLNESLFSFFSTLLSVIDVGPGPADFLVLGE